MRRTVLAVVIATVLPAIAAPNTGLAQSFDCAKATTAVEKKICDDPDLGQMDTELGSVYTTLRKALDGEAKAKLQQTERRWQRQRNACDAKSDCLTKAYVQRLQTLAQNYDVFPGWSGDFATSTGLQIAITHDGGRKYSLALSGAGQDWTCDGEIAARLSENGHALSVQQNGDPVRVRAAGTGVWIPPALETVVNRNGLCGARAPNVSGFFARKSTGGDASLGFDRSPFIHPQIVRELATWLSDSGDQVVAINLTDSQDSNRFFGDFKVEPASSKGAAPTVSMTKGDDQFSYKLAGTMTNGVHVLKTVQSSTDGTGAFPTLLLVSFRKDRGIKVNWAANAIEPGAARLLLVKHGEIPVGSNWTGELKVEGNRLFIGADQSGNPSSGDGNSGWLTFSAASESAQ